MTDQAQPTLPTADPDLDRRRRRAHRSAVFSVTLGTVALAIFSALFAFVVLFAVARFTTWVSGDSIEDSPVWDVGPVAAIALAAATVGLSALAALRAILFGGVRWLFKGIAVRRPTAEEATRLTHVVEALAIGLGTTPPELGVVDDVAPNAISARSRRSSRLVVTTGLLGLPRDQLEAVCAHEMAGLAAGDAALVTAGFMATSRGHAISIGALGIGGLLLAGSAYAAFEGELFLPSVFLTGLGMVVVAGPAAWLLQRAVLRLRSAVDDVADVAAVHLSRHPEALAQVLRALARDERRVTCTTSRSQHAWFEGAETIVASAWKGQDNEKAKRVERLAAANGRIRDELTRRAELAEATARGLGGQ